MTAIAADLSRPSPSLHGAAAPARAARQAAIFAILLDRLGVGATGYGPGDGAPDGGSVDALVERLRARGRAARAVRASARMLGTLPLPTLVSLRSQSWPAAILARVGARSVTLELSDGSSRDVPLGNIGRLLGDWALDLSAPAPASTSASGRLFTTLLRALAEQRRRIAGLFVLSLPAQGLELLAPLAMKTALDDALPSGATSLLQILALALVGLSVHRAWLGWLRATAQRHLGAALEVSMLRAVFAHALRLPYRDLRQLRVGDLSQTLSSAAATSALATRLALLPVDEGIRAAVALVLLLVFQASVAPFLLAISAVLVAAAGLLSWRHAQLQSAELEATVREQSYLSQLITGAPTIRAMGAARSIVARWLRRLIDEQAASLRRMRLVVWLDMVCDGSQGVVSLGLLLFGASRCLAGELSIGSMMALVMWGDSFLGATLQLAHTLFQVSGGVPAYRRAQALLDRPTEASEAALAHARLDGAGAAVPAAATVSIKNVWFRYGPEEPWILRNQSLEIGAGERVCLKGRSGIGKTTLLRLVAGLLAPERGTVTINGRSAIESRGLVSYLPQDAYLFEGALMRNLRLLSGAPAARILEAAARTGLDSWVGTLPMGYDTLMSAGGQNVSGGQRQLILLTAALASNRPVVLFDEANAHLDRLARSQLQVGSFFAGRTILDIVHDSEEAASEVVLG